MGHNDPHNTDFEVLKNGCDAQSKLTVSYKIVSVVLCDRNVCSCVFAMETVKKNRYKNLSPKQLVVAMQ